MTATLQDPDYRAFVEHPIAIRKRLGVQQAELASRLGRRQPYISKCERFERRVDVAEFRAIVAALGLDPVAEFAAVSVAMKARR